MKLIDLLVRDLWKFGGWPEGAYECHRFVYEANIDFYDEHGNWDGDCFVKYGDFAAEIVRKRSVTCDSESVTKSQYEAALAASQPQWNGEGLPPVGCECEARFIIGGEWFFFRCVAIDCEIAFGWSGKEPTTLNLSGYEFRPIRSEADKKRDEAVEAIDRYMPEFIPDTPNDYYHAKKIYDAIAVGKIPGVKLED